MNDLTTEEGCRAELKRLKDLHTQLSKQIDSQPWINPVAHSHDEYRRLVMAQERTVGELRWRRKKVYFEMQRVDCLLFELEYPYGWTP